MNTILNRTQRICQPEFTPRFADGSVAFLDESGLHVQIDSDTWRDMGEPETITVTIEPGDTLNSGRQATLTARLDDLQAVSLGAARIPSAEVRACVFGSACGYDMGEGDACLLPAGHEGQHS